MRSSVGHCGRISSSLSTCSWSSASACVIAGVLDRERHLGGHRVLVQRHRDAAQALRRAHRRVDARPVVADQREVVAALEPLRGQAAGERAHFVGEAAPAPGLPDAEVLLADCRTLRRAPWRGASAAWETYPAPAGFSAISPSSKGSADFIMRNTSYAQKDHDAGHRTLDARKARYGCSCGASPRPAQPREGHDPVRARLVDGVAADLRPAGARAGPIRR